jgi:hypothetical protein
LKIIFTNHSNKQLASFSGRKHHVTALPGTREKSKMAADQTVEATKSKQ